MTRKDSAAHRCPAQLLTEPSRDVLRLHRGWVHFKVPSQRENKVLQSFPPMVKHTVLLKAARRKTCHGGDV
jgi:hypothetical protein